MQELHPHFPLSREAHPPPLNGKRIIKKKKKKRQKHSHGLASPWGKTTLLTCRESFLRVEIVSAEPDQERDEDLEERHGQLLSSVIKLHALFLCKLITRFRNAVFPALMKDGRPRWHPIRAWLRWVGGGGAPIADSGSLQVSRTERLTAIQNKYYSGFKSCLGRLWPKGFLPRIYIPVCVESMSTAASVSHVHSLVLLRREGEEGLWAWIGGQNLLV